MISGARALPLSHLSVRVPWHDNAWTGTVCDDPINNAECLALRRIREDKDDQAEAAVAGRPWNELKEAQLPACLNERASFMAPFEVVRTAEHPYVGSSKAHAHFRPTEFRMPPYSASCIPFRWMLRDGAVEIAEQLGLGYEPELEEHADELIGFNTIWVQDKRNQLVLLESFFSAVAPERSLAFFYAKRTPLSEDPRRVLIGAARVLDTGMAREYEYLGQGELNAVLWEWPVRHSLRPDFKDGFLLPYHQLLQISEADPSFDLEACVAYAPEDHWGEFSYSSEHVTHDAAIGSLLECARAIKVAQGSVTGDWNSILEWIDLRLAEVWRLRGPFPGLGAALRAFGVPGGTLLAHQLASEAGENEDPWPAFQRWLESTAARAGGLGLVGKTTLEKWRALPDERRSLLLLLSRFDLAPDQATRLYQPTEREKARILGTDRDLLENPYLLYELDRHSPEPVAVGLVDRGTFPDSVVQETHPLPSPSAMDDATDPRRVRALVVSYLEARASDGHTLRPAKDVVQAIRDMAISPGCPVDADLMALVEAGFDQVVDVVEMADGTQAYQLRRLTDCGQLIRSAIGKRMKGARVHVDADWGHLLAIALTGELDEAELQAREEKRAALTELASSRISVLIGPAGTGKTTLLSILTSVPPIAAGGVLLLAPTGKARVQMTKATASEAQTVAQFLLRHDRYEPDTGEYHLSSAPKVEAAKTVVIDEASMLTEEQLAATLDALKGVERLILVGDPRQLPPIGSGRPFVDIVARLAPDDVTSMFPRIAPGYCELTVRRRQQGAARHDLLLADWYSGQAPGPGGDEIWDLIASGTPSNTLETIAWTDEADLRQRLLEVLVRELALEDPDDVEGFERSLGGNLYNGHIYFNRTRDDSSDGVGKVEDWQVLSPVRGQGHGVTALNRMFQEQFRTHMREFAQQQGWKRRVPKPYGPEGILYGDKVINVVNKRMKEAYPDGSMNYVANGEIGVVVGQFKSRNMKRPPWMLKVEFSTQPGYEYGYWNVGDEGSPPLELAYALTIHKAQGSEFGKTLLVLPDPCRLLSRELLYTALTRQREKVILLHQGGLTQLKGYASPSFSESALRLTNLFGAPTPVEIESRFLEDGLIHRTQRGEAVRSKSEVIIADLLYSRGLDYEYERQLVGSDGSIRYPDFTVDDSELGRTIYWEHLGLMADPIYRERWERKLRWYQKNGVRSWDEAPGEPRVLVVSSDDERGGIDAQGLAQLAQTVFTS